MTMHVHSYEVTFRRTRQPKDYETSDASVTLKASFDEGEEGNPVEVAHSLMSQAQFVVYNAVGLSDLANKAIGDPEPAVTETKPKAEPKKTKPKAEPKKEPAKETAKTDDVPDDSDSKTKETAKTDDVPDDKEPAKETAKTDDVPDDGGEKTGGKKTADTSDVPDDGGEKTGGDGAMTAADLQKYVTEMVSTRKITVQQVKEILAGYKASRASDVPADKREEAKAAIELIVEGIAG